MLDDWAFARVELAMGSEEFFALSPRQWDAIIEQWKAKKQREIALHLSCALNARWGHKDNVLPFSMSDFLPPPPKSEEEQAADDARLAKTKAAVLAGFYRDLVRELPPITQPKQIKKRKTKKPRGR